ncbi:microfibril-associated glycoprotein 4-like [Asterias amurensis]|uniref:microfibril-associated glycoprotein 4-like n=1 Tax=Asterias amurensis TaxID=7602 RepID=UPI003AB53A65
MNLQILSVLYFMTIWWFSPLMVAEKFGIQCGQLKHQFFSAENMVLKNFVYKNKTVTNHVICGRDCGLEKDCKSFNFYKCRGFCELNNATRKEHTEDFVEDQESLYFDMDEGTPTRSIPTTHFFSTQSPLPKLSSCQKFREAGYSGSNVYTVYPSGPSAADMRVYCDMVTDDRGWIVFQRRLNGSVDFNRNWAEYKSGFGDPSGEYWLGNDNLVALTSADFTKLRVVLESDGETGYVEYDGVSVTGSEYIFTYTNYILGAPAKNSLNDNKGKMFTTRDRDNDEASGNCAEQTHGAWWFKDCTVKSHLNGEYEQNPVGRRGIVWYEWNQPIKACSMILRKP